MTTHFSCKNTCMSVRSRPYQIQQHDTLKGANHNYLGTASGGVAKISQDSCNNCFVGEIGSMNKQMRNFHLSCWSLQFKLL
jgi:hypothetical protein